MWQWGSSTETTWRHSLAATVAVSLTLLAVVSGRAAAADVEVPHNFKASETLPPEMLKGAHFQVRQTVVCHGYMHRFTVDSDYGVFEVTGNGALRKLIKEIHALAALAEVKKGKAFLDAAKSNVAKPLEFGKNLIHHPVDTVAGVPKGVFRLLGNVATSVTHTRGAGEDSRASAVLTMSSHKRDWAAELGVDPYSSNRALQKELNSVAWASAVGGLGVTVVTAPIGGPVMKVVKATRAAETFNQILAESPPPQLRQINAKKLADMGITDDLAEKLLDHRSFTPRHATVVVGALAELTGARGRDAFLALTLTAADEVEATFYQDTAMTLRGYNEKVAPIREIAVLETVVLATDGKGSVVIPFPLDHGFWTSRANEVLGRVAVAARQKAAAGGDVEIWVTGQVSPLARRQLRQIGIKPVENVDQRVGLMD